MRHCTNCYGERRGEEVAEDTLVAEEEEAEAEAEAKAEAVTGRTGGTGEGREGRETFEYPQSS